MVGLPLYLAFRPLSYRWERGYWREALMNTVTICPHCEQIVDKSYNACVYCGESLKTECKECHQKYTIVLSVELQILSNFYFVDERKECF